MIQVIRFALFAFAAMIAPGQNNLLLMYSNANFGFKKTIPYYLGLTLAVSVMLFLTAVVFALLLEDQKQLHLIVANLGTLNVLFFASQIVRKNEDKDAAPPPAPLTFLRSFIVQFINPEVWLICITLSGMFRYSSNMYINALCLIGAFIVMNIPCQILWFFIGRGMAKYIKDTNIRTYLNIGFSFFLTICLIALWM